MEFNEPSVEEKKVILAAYKWIYENEHLKYYTCVSTFCTFATGTGTFYAIGRLSETSCGAADYMTTAAAVGMAALTLLGSSTWMLYVSHRYRSLQKRKPARLDVPFVYMDMTTDRSLRFMKKLIPDLEKAILKGVASSGQNVPEKLSESENAAPNQQKEVPDEA